MPRYRAPQTLLGEPQRTKHRGPQSCTFEPQESLEAHSYEVFRGCSAMVSPFSVESKSWNHTQKRLDEGEYLWCPMKVRGRPNPKQNWKICSDLRARSKRYKHRLVRAVLSYFDCATLVPGSRSFLQIGNCSTSPLSRRVLVVSRI